MPTEMGNLLSTGTLYLRNEDGTMTPIMRSDEMTFPECTKGTSEFDGEIPRIREMTFTMRVKRRPTRAQLRAAGFPTRRRSKRAIGRPIRRIKRRIEKARRYTIKKGIDKKIIAHFTKYLEEHCGE